MPDDQIFVIVPAYNEAATIRAVVERLLARYTHVVVVDDASTDGTSQCLAGLDVWLLRHILNRGQGAALQTGIDFALGRGARVLVTFDADGQHDEKDIPALVAPILRGECDVCFGSRFLGRAPNIPLTRWLTLKGGVLFMRLVSGIEVTDAHNGLRAFSARAAAAIRITMDRMAHASEIPDQVLARGLRFREVPVTIYYTDRSLAKGQSSWNAVRIALQIFVEKLAK